MTPQTQQQLASLLKQALNLLRLPDPSSTETVSSPTPTPPSARRPLAWGSEIKRILGPEKGEEFLEGVLWIEQELGIDSDDLLSCMAFETGRKFRSNTKSPVSSATGLIQFMEATAKGMGTTTAALAAMPEITQLGYVYRYFKPYSGKLRSIADIYMAILWPKGIGLPLSAPIFVQGQSTYRPNAGLDKDKDGKITKAEAAAKVMTMLAEGLKPENVG